MPTHRGMLDAVLANGDWAAVERLCEQHALRIALEYPDYWPAVFHVADDGWVRARPRMRHLRTMVEAYARDVTWIDPDGLGAFSAWVAAQERPSPRDVLADALGRMRYLLALGRLPEAVALADLMEKTIGGADSFAGFDDAVPSALIAVGTTRLLAGDIDGSIASFMSAVRWSTVGEPHPAARHARNFLAMAYALRGDIVRARLEATHDATAPTSPPGTLGFVLESATQYLPVLLAIADLDRARAEAGLAALVRAPSVFWWLDTAVRARFALIWGECESAAHAVEHDLIAHRALAGSGTMARSMLASALADLRFASGHIDAAWAAVNDAVDAPSSAALDATRHRLSGATLPVPGGSTLRGAHHVINAVAAERRGRDAERDRHIARAVRSITLDGDLSAVVEATTATRASLHANAIPKPVDEASAPSARSLGDLWQQEPLTGRELDVLRTLGRHATVRAIAAELYLSTNTVKTHLRNLYRKLGVSTRSGALSAAEAMRIATVRAEATTSDVGDDVESAAC